MKIVAIATLAAAAALAVAGCSGDDGPEIAAAGGLATGQLSAEALQAGTGGGGGAQGITVTGTGSASAVPDVADWSFGVQSDADTASAALSQNAEAMDRLLNALKGQGIAKDDLRTEQVSLYPRTTDDGRAVVGYTASSSVHATIRKMSEAGKVVDAAVAAGANNVYGPTLRLSDSEAQYRAAVDAAYDDALSRARAIAEKAGVTLGAPLAIVEGGGGYPGPLYDRMAVAESGGGEVAIEPGKQEVGATLTVTFAIG